MSTAKPSTPPTKRLDLGLKHAIDIARDVARADNVPTMTYPQNAPEAPPATSAIESPVPQPAEVATPKAAKTNITPLNAAEKKPKAAPRAAVKRYSVDLPLYAIEDIRDKAHKAKLTKREYILTALNKGGITIKDIDIREPRDE